MGLFTKPKVEGGVAVYGTGVKRSASDARFDLITPIGLRRVAQAAHVGAQKYGEYNCEKGLPISVYLNHALAHVNAFLSGDRSEDHLGHAAWNLLFACHSEELTPELNTDLRVAGCRPPQQVQEEARQPVNPLLGGR